MGEPKLEVPTIYIRPTQGLRGYSPKIWPHMVQYLHSRILDFPWKYGMYDGFMIGLWWMILVCIFMDDGSITNDTDIGMLTRKMMMMMDHDGS